MSTQSPTFSASHVESRVTTPAHVSTVQQFLWALRREFWESRSIYIAPVAVGALAVFGYVIGAWRHLPADLHKFPTDALKGQQQIDLPYDIAGGLMMLVTSLVGALYSVDALYGERRDRSILFWKSLPVSDFMTVLAKTAIPLLVLPVIGWAVALVTQILMALIASVVVVAKGSNLGDLWAHLPLWRMSILLLYHLVTVHGLWWAPFYGWLLLVSAWARRAPILWATVPVAAIAIFEKFAFNTTHFLGLLENRLGGDPRSVDLPMKGMFPTHPLAHMTPIAYVTNPSLWIGLGVTAVFLLGAVRMRRYREPI